MEIKLRHIADTIIEITVENFGASITSDVTNLQGLVSKELINNLREVAEELELHNEQIEAGVI